MDKPSSPTIHKMLRGEAWAVGSPACSFHLHSQRCCLLIEMPEEHILASLNGLCCPRTDDDDDDDERLGLCSKRAISEGKDWVVQYVNRRQGCGLVQFSLFFFLKTWSSWHLVMKMNHMQLLPHCPWDGCRVELR